MRHIWNRRQLDLESELRGSRSDPRADFVKEKPTAAKHAQIASKSAAQAQYGQFTPPTVEPKAAAAAATQTKVKPATPKASQLPFTGLALWMPLAIGFLLLATGLVLRTRSRRHSSGAHS